MAIAPARGAQVRVNGAVYKALDRAIAHGRVRCQAALSLVLLSETRDITATKQAMANLAESDARFRALADCMPQMIWAAPL